MRVEERISFSSRNYKFLGHVEIYGNFIGYSKMRFRIFNVNVNHNTCFAIQFRSNFKLKFKILFKVFYK